MNLIEIGEKDHRLKERFELKTTILWKTKTLNSKFSKKLTNIFSVKLS